MERNEPLVSVIIPTRARPHLVGRAIGSALTQSLHSIEVIVVVDDPDEATFHVLRKIDDPRLRLKTLPRHVALPDARNAGVNEAQGQWIAFLDDDDEWFPQKLEIQLQTARQSTYRYPIIACRVVARSEVGDFVWPRRFPRPDELLSEYLFCRKSPFFGEGVIGFNTVFTTKELLQMVPLRSGLRDLDDLDWLLRASRLEGVGIEFVPKTEPLAVWHIEENRNRMSNRADWRYSLSWIRANRHLVTPHAYASFIMTWMGPDAARAGDWKAFLPLLREAYQHGKPAIIDALSYLGTWLIHREVRRRIAAFFARRQL